MANNPVRLLGRLRREGFREGGVSQSISHGNCISSSRVDLPLFSTTNSNVKQVVTAMESRPSTQYLLSVRDRKQPAHFDFTFGIPGLGMGPSELLVSNFSTATQLLHRLLLKGNTSETP